MFCYVLSLITAVAISADAVADGRWPAPVNARGDAQGVSVLVSPSVSGEDEGCRLPTAGQLTPIPSNETGLSSEEDCGCGQSPDSDMQSDDTRASSGAATFVYVAASSRFASNQCWFHDFEPLWPKFRRFCRRDFH